MFFDELNCPLPGPYSFMLFFPSKASASPQTLCRWAFRLKDMGARNRQPKKYPSGKYKKRCRIVKRDWLWRLG